MKPPPEKAQRTLRQKLRHTEQGVTAVVIALSILMLFAAGAAGFDIATLMNARQRVRDAIDAAAQAVAYDMPVASASAALTTASTFAQASYSAVTLTASNLSFYCVVKKASDGTPDESQIPTTCNPGVKGTDWSDTSSNCPSASAVCTIPCTPSTAPVSGTATACNTIVIKYNLQVPFVFGQVIGIPSGYTGTQSTISCRGTCGGSMKAAPMNVVVMADRTASMWGTFTSVDSSSGKVTGTGNDNNIAALRSGIEGMLQTMTPTQQYVAFGAIHQGQVVTPTSGADNLTAPLPKDAKAFKETTNCTLRVLGVCWSSKTTSVNQFVGSWVPVGFTNNYLTSTGALNTGTDLYASVHNLAYANLTTSGTNGTSATYYTNKLWTSDGSNYAVNGTGTHLASALKGAVEYLQANAGTNNYVSGLDSDGYRASLKDSLGNTVPVKNVIVFETDGQPDEVFDDANSDTASALSFSNTDDVGSTTMSRACTNFASIATAAKAAGITLIMISFGSANTASCTSTQTAGQIMANAASTKASVTGSGDSNGCADAASIAAENTDNDYYYCAATAADLKGVFAAAMGNMTDSTKFMSIGDIGN